MSNHKTCLCMLAFILTAACTKKEFAPVKDVPHEKVIGDLDCDPANPEFIHGEFNTVPVCFNTIKSATDTFSNAYYRNSSIHLDHINLIRKNLNKTMSCQIHFINPDLQNQKLPYVLPHPAPGYNEYAEIIISDLNKLWSTNIDDDYIGNTYKGFSITITDTTGGYLTGNFSGFAATKGGKKVQIDNGDFYVRIINTTKN